MTLINDFRCIFNVLGFTGESESVLRLAVRDLVDSMVCFR